MLRGIDKTSDQPVLNLSLDEEFLELSYRFPVTMFPIQIIREI